jgi:hypothetical protein
MFTFVTYLNTSFMPSGESDDRGAGKNADACHCPASIRFETARFETALLTEWVDSSEDFKEITWDNRPTLPRQTFHFNPVS